ncbi:hypothetical protein [Kosakonia cowanii]|uniref:hypothetical protein n=1 Tax=Kosakonia cowanii TaxID=208223 RepID=UPI0025A95897|nr:hypothetical protein [Kosakonia cowanii]MDM9618715.1 hypothetical protein [Kosakonia cowanii]
MQAGSHISTPMWVLFALPPACQPIRGEKLTKQIKIQKNPKTIKKEKKKKKKTKKKKKKKKKKQKKKKKKNKKKKKKKK